MLEILLSKKVLGPIFIVIGFSLVYFIIKNVIKKTMIKKKNNRENKRTKTIISLVNNLIKYFLMIIAALMILSIYGIDTSALITSLGVVGLMAGLALQDILKDLLAGISIITENQYTIGDIVTINGFKGEVITLGIKTTTLRSEAGDIKFISNRNITEVINHSTSFSLANIELTIVGFDIVQKLEEELEKLFERLNKEIPYLKGDIKLLGIEQLNQDSVTFKTVAKTEPLKNLEVERLLRKEIKNLIDDLGKEAYGL